MADTQAQAAGKQMPTGVKVISVLYYIGAAFALIGGILLIAGGGLMGSLIEELGVFALFGGLFLVLGVIFIGLAILSFFIGRGLWKGQKWARIIAIIFAILGVLGAISSLIGGEWVSGIINLIIQGLIGYYLLFNKAAKEAFS